MRRKERTASQGAFWEMHDVLYENQGALEDEDLAENMPPNWDWTRCASISIWRHIVMRPGCAETLSGVRSGVNGTPTFFINGIRHDGAWDAGSLIEAIRALLE